MCLLRVPGSCQVEVRVGDTPVSKSRPDSAHKGLAFSRGSLLNAQFELQENLQRKRAACREAMITMEG